MTTRTASHCCLLGIALALSCAVSLPAYGDEPIRIWVDSSGRYSVQAALVRREGDMVVLRRQDGGQTRMPVERISVRDQEYLSEYEQQQQTDATSPTPSALILDRPVKQLPRLVLPRANSVASENSTLQVGVVTETISQLAPPPELDPDPNPDSIDLSLVEFSAGGINSFDRCSPLLCVGTPDHPALGMSVTVAFALPGSASVNRVVKFDLEKSRTRVVHQSDEAVTLLDHHPHSKQSLALVGHTSSGKGGRLAIATGWRSDEFSLDFYRVIPGYDDDDVAVGQGPSVDDSLPYLRWARWIDDQHIVAIVDRSLVGWNLVSGEMIFRIDGIHPSCVPAMSGGRRQLAIPVAGGVVMVNTTDGKVIGRIAGEPRTVPAASFSQNGNALAVSSQRRLVVWDLALANEATRIDSKRSLGSKATTWIDSDLILSSSGVLLSLQRKAPIWRYHLTDTRTYAAKDHLAVFRKRPDPSLAIVKMPHDGANVAMRWLDANGRGDTRDMWQLPGRSVWEANQWHDRDVRVGTSRAKSLK